VPGPDEPEVIMSSLSAVEAPAVRLTVVEGLEEPVTLPMLGSRFLIGRGESCQLRLHSPFVSRRHSAIEIAGDFVLLRDLGSINGTLLNGKRAVAPVSLVDGDRITVGPVTIVASIRAPRGRPRDAIAEWLVSHGVDLSATGSAGDEGPVDDGPETWPSVEGGSSQRPDA
jgi:pSer/pThr/pTyr-binding forkhead associated (FHA) protein